MFRLPFHFPLCQCCDIEVSSPHAAFSLKTVSPRIYATCGPPPYIPLRPHSPTRRRRNFACVSGLGVPQKLVRLIHGSLICFRFPAMAGPLACSFSCIYPNIDTFQSVPVTQAYPSSEKNLLRKLPLGQPSLRPALERRRDLTLPSSSGVENFRVR